MAIGTSIKAYLTVQGIRDEQAPLKGATTDPFVCLALDSGKLYLFDSTSTAADDNDVTLVPTGAPAAGRYIKKAIA